MITLLKRLRSMLVDPAVIDPWGTDLHSPSSTEDLALPGAHCERLGHALPRRAAPWLPRCRSRLLLRVPGPTSSSLRLGRSHRDRAQALHELLGLGVV